MSTWLSVWTPQEFEVIRILSPKVLGYMKLKISLNVLLFGIRVVPVLVKEGVLLLQSGALTVSQKYPSCEPTRVLIYIFNKWIPFKDFFKN